MKQLTHEEFNENRHALSICIICDKLQSAANLGSIFRSAEAFGVSTIYLHLENKQFLNQARFIKTSRHTFKSIKIESYSNRNHILKDLKSKKYRLIALEKCDISQRLQDITFTAQTCIIVGNENNGVHPVFLENSDRTVHIDMFGKNSSMNVSQALTVALFECIRQQL